MFKSLSIRMVSFVRERLTVLVILCVTVVFVFFLVFDRSEQTEIEAEESWEEMFETEDETAADVGGSSKTLSEKIVVDIKGEIENPGVYEFEEGERVIDAVEKAGGLTAEANEDVINFAKRLFDEKIIVVPNENEEEVVEGGSLNDSMDRQNRDDEQVNINAATVIDLQTIPSVGEVRAQSIIDEREENGRFESKQDLSRVTGIGEKTAETIDEHVFYR
ncbi:helix-hairpin-helix domain-containing protein [Texcoconibacillus texcoconensis]|uniref:Competence protein ComEA n=1 Tax=Texcoconibacillus texcoconensis TaxID=1095777 RepID=A0A840QRH5_9BACI|nr:helix-hairpin-helix domain-containing protein [Texcoconibacillus texcoconensis]MBB5173965.1 competence protein ComEA [Texcoconibacillus texcoconensis]